MFRESMGGTRPEEGGAGLSWPGSLCTLLFQCKMFFSLAHLTPPFKVHFRFKLSLFLNFIYLFIYLFIYGCVGSSFLCEGFL